MKKTREVNWKPSSISQDVKVRVRAAEEIAQGQADVGGHRVSLLKRSRMSATCPVSTRDRGFPEEASIVGDWLMFQVVSCNVQGWVWPAIQKHARRRRNVLGANGER